MNFNLPIFFGVDRRGLRLEVEVILSRHGNFAGEFMGGIGQRLEA